MAEEKAAKAKLFGWREFLSEPHPEEFDFRDLMKDYYEAYAEIHKNEPDYYNLLIELIKMNKEDDPVKKWYLYKTLDVKPKYPEDENKKNKHPFDCDNSYGTCRLSANIYEMLWGTEILEKLNAGKIYKGDTMNSVATTLHALTGLKIPKKPFEDENDSAQKDRQNIKNAPVEDIKKHLNSHSSAIEFIRVAHTIGNFIPVPSQTKNHQSFNTKRSSCYAQDYWDRTLYCIYRWYMDNPNIKCSVENDQKNVQENVQENDHWLKKLLLADENQGIEGNTIVMACKAWLKAFSNEKDNPSWDIFIEKNYLQDYTLWSTKPYGPPKEFWKGHFSEGAEALPQTQEQFEAFFTHATACIKARSARMVAALRASVRNK